MAKLILHLDGSTKEFQVEGELLLGRHASCAVFLEEPKASRRHARITRKGEAYELEDLESSNGTKVNGKKVDTHTLAHGDTIQIGATRLVFDAPELAQHSAAERPGDPSEAASPREPREKDKAPRALRSTDDPLVGTTLEGHRILARIGQGGMGTVYEALQLSLDRNVALKVLKPELARDRTFAKEFIREARAAGQFQHPGLVEIHDVNEANGILYYTMELVDGESAMERLKRKGKLELAEVLDIGIGVADVLVQLSNEDAVHQDIKPHNILLANDGGIKLTDFGLASIDGRIRRIAPDPDGILGTPYYMSPEQASRAKRVTAKSDLYSLGCTLFHLLTGKVPFEGNSAIVVLAKHANQTRPDAREQNPDIPDVLADLLKEMMAIEPEERPESAEDVLEQLKHIKTGLNRTAGVPPVRPGPSGASRRRAADEPRSVAPPRGMDPVTARLLQVGVIAVMLVLGFQLARNAVASLDPDHGQNGKTTVAATNNNDPPKKNGEDIPPPVENKQTLPNPGDQGQKNPPKIDPDIEAAFKAALEKRDRAMQSSNLSGARLAINEFLRAHPNGEIARLARQAYLDTQKEINGVCEQIFSAAEAAAAQKNYRLTAAKCTGLISSDPKSAFADRARALMGRLDLETQANFAQARAASRKALNQGKLPEARGILQTALDELGGTKWTGELQAEQLHILLADRFLKDMDAARKELADKGKPVRIAVPDLKGVKQPSLLRGVTGLQLKTELDGVTLAYSMEKMTPGEIRLLVSALGLSDQHLGLSNLFAILNQPAEEQKEFMAAQGIPEQAREIERLSLSQSGVSNLKRYDFNKWEQQSDWEASTGAWSTKDEQYTLESTDAGDTYLKPAAIGGPFPARNARIGFEFTPKERKEGYFISAEFGDEQRNVALLFTSTGWELQVAADERAKTHGSWGNGQTKVELAIDDKDAVTLILNDKAEAPFPVKGLSNLKGTISFHAREASCSFDNVVLRTKE